MPDHSTGKFVSAPHHMLRTVPILSALPDADLAALAGRMSWCTLQAGDILFHEGEPSSDLYVVRSGALSVLRSDGNGPVQIGVIYAGETVGEMAMLTGEPRTATVAAMRDSEVGCLSRDTVEELAKRFPAIALGMAQVLARRLARMQPLPRSRGRPRVTMLDAIGSLTDAAVLAFANTLQQEIRHSERVAIVAQPWADDWREALQAIETSHDFVLLVPGRVDAEWHDFCCRQADAVFMLADRNDAPAAFTHVNRNAVLELILLSGREPQSGSSAQWMNAVGASSVHHVRDAEDIVRLARLITRRALSVVLSGGGARSFAHIGILQALREAGIVPDIYGGASMGAVIAAAYAAGFSDDVIRADLRRAFVDSRPLSDPRLPVVSFFQGRKVSTMLKQAFGERHIEDLRKPFFCVSSDINTAASVIHRTGLLRRWLQASAAIPGVFPPLIEDGAVLVDGGVIDNLPIDAAAALQRGPVIGIDVSGDDESLSPPADRPIPWWQRISGARNPGEPDIVETLWRVGTIGSIASLSRGRRAAELIIRPPVARIPLLDWKKFDSIVDAGYSHGVALLKEQPELFAFLPAKRL